jgi:hypothetical protein
VKKNYAKIKEIFITLAVKSSYPSISLLDFSSFIASLGFLSDPSSTLTLQHLDRLFIAANYEVEEQDENPDRSLNRFEFIEVLVRVAGVRYRDTKMVGRYSEAMDLLLTQDLYPKWQEGAFGGFSAGALGWQEFRDE